LGLRTRALIEEDTDMAEIHKGDIGTIFLLTLRDGGTAVNVASASSTKNIIFKKPSGEVITKGAAFNSDGSDGKIKYTTVLGDLNEVGYWEMQAEVVITAGTFKSEVEGFLVKRNL